MRELMNLRGNEGEMNMCRDKERMEAIAGELLVRFEEQSELVKEINREIEKAKADGANAEEKAKSEEERLKELGIQIKGAAKNQAMSCLNGKITTKNARIEANEKNIKEVHECSFGFIDVLGDMVEVQIGTVNSVRTLLGIPELLLQYQQETAKLVKIVYNLFAYDTEMNEETNEIMKSMIEKMEAMTNNEALGEVARQEVREALTTVKRGRDNTSLKRWRRERREKVVNVWLTVVTILAVLGLFL